MGHLIGLLLLVATPAAFAADAATVSKPVRVVTNTIKAQAIVESIDAKTREIKLLGADNRRFTITADASVRNFDQIHPRDRVNIEYLESVAIDVFAAGSPAPAAALAAVDVAQQGDKPGLAGVAVAQIEATVTGLDREARRATLLFPDGSSAEVKVREEARLDLVNVGDRVRMTATKAVAINVTPPPQ
jgi:hypothetical protein